MDIYITTMLEGYQALFITFLYKILYFFTLFKNNFLTYSERFYNTPIGRSIADNINNMKYTVCHDWFQLYMENPKNYCGIFSVTPIYNEWFDDNTFFIRFVDEIAENIENVDSVMNSLKSMHKDKNDLIILKSDNFTIYRLANSDVKVSEPKNVKNRFLTIEYRHKNMESPIDITLQKSDLLEDNEILSFTFLNKHLLYNYSNFVIDNEYALYIVDTDLNTLELNYDKYIKLTQSGYEIASL